jgi:hypothetical protein
VTAAVKVLVQVLEQETYRFSGFFCDEHALMMDVKEETKSKCLIGLLESELKQREEKPTEVETAKGAHDLLTGRLLV